MLTTVLFLLHTLLLSLQKKHLILFKSILLNIATIYLIIKIACHFKFFFYQIKKFITNLEKSTDKLKDWNSELWMLTVESATVYRDKRIKFKFYDGIVNK